MRKDLEQYIPAMARALSDRWAPIHGIKSDDYWQCNVEDFTEDARAMLSVIPDAQSATQVAQAEPAEVVYRWMALDYSGYCYGSNPPKNLPHRCCLKAFYALPDVQTVPEGWKLVPVDISQRMVLAWLNQDMRELKSHGVNPDRKYTRIANNYHAMLSAAPTPPAREVQS